MLFMTRHKCVICKRTRNEDKMINVFHISWACDCMPLVSDFSRPSEYCSHHSDIFIMREILELNSKFKIIDIGYIKSATNIQQIFHG